MDPRRLVIGVLALGISACTSSAPQPIAPEEAHVVPTPPPASPAGMHTPSADPAPTPPLERHPAGVAAEKAERPPAPIGLGRPCTHEDPHCGTAGRIAMVMERLQFQRPAPPCSATRTSPDVANNAAKACVDGERIFIASTCIVCRIASEERLLGLVSEMTPEQLRAAQKLAALPEAPLLTKTSDWTAAIAAAGRRVQTR
jgi:hypothetical protein